jgi:hypothetical protein
MAAGFMTGFNASQVGQKQCRALHAWCATIRAVTPFVATETQVMQGESTAVAALRLTEVCHPKSAPMHDRNLCDRVNGCQRCKRAGVQLETRPYRAPSYAQQVSDTAVP